MVPLALPRVANRVLLAHHDRQQRIVPQIVVVVQVFVAQGQGIDPLAHQFFDRVLDEV